MIIDGDTHISLKGGKFALEVHLETMELAGVDKTLVWLSPWDYVGKEIAEHNKYIYEAAKAYPEKILPFGWTDPTIGVEYAKKIVRLCAEDYGFYGIKMNGAQNNYYIDDPKIALPVAEEIARTGKMIAFHIGPDAYEQTHPWRAMKIAKMFPETKILMVHMGMTDKKMVRAVIEIAEECPNMTLIASATWDREALQAIKALGVSRVCFGSDNPFRKMRVVKAMFQTSFEEELSNKEIEDFMGKNLANLVGIEI